MDYIYVTDHAITRYKERRKLVTREIAIKKITQNVKRSKIIAIDKNGKETREYKGLLFVCKMEDYVLTVITVMFGEVCSRFVK